MKVQTRVIDNSSSHTNFMEPENWSPDICHDKYDRMFKCLVNTYTILDKFASSVTMSQDDSSAIHNFAQSGRNNIEQYRQTPNMFSPDLLTKWREFKNTNEVKQNVVLCSSLYPYRVGIENKSSLNSDWIKHSTLGTRIFGFSNYDVYVSFQNANEHMRNYILLALHLLYTNSHDVYEMYTTPDFDVDSFIDATVSSMDDLKKHPELQRCTRAIKVIKNNTKLFKERFNEYYIDFLQSGNQHIIFENYLSDVINNINIDKRTLLEFRTIFNYFNKHYSKLEADANTNEKVSKIREFIGKALNTCIDDKNVDANDTASTDDDDTSDDDKHRPQQSNETPTTSTSSDITTEVVATTKVVKDINKKIDSIDDVNTLFTSANIDVPIDNRRRAPHNKIGLSIANSLADAFNNKKQ